MSVCLLHPLLERLDLLLERLDLAGELRGRRRRWLCRSRKDERNGSHDG